MAGAPVAGIQLAGLDAVALNSSEFAFGSAHMGDVEQFLAAMGGNGVGIGAVGQGQEAAAASGSIYAQILGPLNEFRAKFDRIITGISGIASRGEVSMRDLFQIQFQLTQLSYMNDISAKTADKISQGTQTLFRNQG